MPNRVRWFSSLRARIAALITFILVVGVGGTGWFIDDVGDVEPCNVQIGGPSEVTTDGTRNLYFSRKSPSKWPKGTYHVYIYVNDNLNLDVDFTVK